MGGGAMRIDLLLTRFNGQEARGSATNFALGTVPSSFEAETAMAVLLQNSVKRNSSSARWELKPVLDCFDPSQGHARFSDALRLLQTDSSFKRLVVSLSSDKAVWEAIMNNELVRKLCISSRPLPAVGNGSHNSNMEAEDIGRETFKWIIDFIKEKVAELIFNFQSLLVEVLGAQEGKPLAAGEAQEQVEEKVRSSLLLSVVILLIVVVARAQGA